MRRTSRSPFRCADCNLDFTRGNDLPRHVSCLLQRADSVGACKYLSLVHSGSALMLTCVARVLTQVGIGPHRSPAQLWQDAVSNRCALLSLRRHFYPGGAWSICLDVRVCDVRDDVVVLLLQMGYTPAIVLECAADNGDLRGMRKARRRGPLTPANLAHARDRAVKRFELGAVALLDKWIALAK